MEGVRPGGRGLPPPKTPRTALEACSRPRIKSPESDPPKKKRKFSRGGCELVRDGLSCAEAIVPFWSIR